MASTITHQSNADAFTRQWGTSADLVVHQTLDDPFVVADHVPADASITSGLSGSLPIETSGGRIVDVRLSEPGAMPATTDDRRESTSRLRRSVAVGAAAAPAGPPRRRRPHPRQPGGHVDHRRFGPRRRVARRRRARARVDRPRRLPTRCARVGHPGRPPGRGDSGRCRRRRARARRRASSVHRDRVVEFQLRHRHQRPRGPGVELGDRRAVVGGHRDHRRRGLRHQRPPAARDRRAAVVERGARGRDPALAGAAGIVDRARRIAARRRRRPRRRFRPSGDASSSCSATRSPATGSPRSTCS